MIMPLKRVSPHRLRSPAVPDSLPIGESACSRARPGASERRRVKGPGALRTPATMSVSFPASNHTSIQEEAGDRSAS